MRNTPVLVAVVVMAALAAVGWVLLRSPETSSKRPRSQMHQPSKKIGKSHQPNDNVTTDNPELRKSLEELSKTLFGLSQDLVREHLSKKLAEFMDHPLTDEELAQIQKKADEMKADYLSRLQNLRNRSSFRPAVRGQGEVGNAWDYYKEPLLKIKKKVESNKTDELVLQYYGSDYLRAFQKELEEAGIDPKTVDIDKRMGEILAENAEYIKTILQGTQQAYADPLYRYEEGMGMLIPHTMGGLHASQLLTAMARGMADQGDIGGALDLYMDSMQFAHDMQQRGIPISYLIGIVDSAIVTSSLQRILENKEISSDKLRELDRAVGILLENGESIETVFEAEYVNFAAEVFGEDKSFGREMRNKIPGDPRYVNAAIDILVTEGMEEYDAYVKRMLSSGYPGMKNLKIKTHNALATSMIPIVPNLVERSYVHRSEMQLLRVVVALKRYIAEHKGLPYRLEELTIGGFLPNVPIDAFTGSPLAYRLSHDGKSARIYSFGPNGEDDSGVPGSSNELDIVVTVKLP